MNLGFLSNVWFYVILVLLGMFGMKYVRKIPLVKKLPKQVLVWGGIVGIVLITGVLGTGFALFGTGSLASGVTISQLQTTTAYHVDNSTGGIAGLTDMGIDNTRQSDFYLSEADTQDNAYIEGGVFMLTRKGSLAPASCKVEVFKPARYDISDTTYHIVDEDANTGIMNVYVETGDTTGVATTASPKEKNQLAFAEGVSTGFVGLRIDIDDTGFIELTQWDTKDVIADLCGYKIRVQNT